MPEQKLLMISIRIRSKYKEYMLAAIIDPICLIKFQSNDKPNLLISRCIWHIWSINQKWHSSKKGIMAYVSSIWTP